jgi:nucleotide-binding universal stress UspA family protein
MTDRDDPAAPPAGDAQPDTDWQALQERLGRQPIAWSGDEAPARVVWPAQIEPDATNDESADIYWQALQERLGLLEVPPEEVPAPELAAPKPARRRLRIRLRRSFIRAAALGLCLLVLIGGVALVLARRAPTATPDVVALAGTLPIDVVKTARVGDPITVTVGPVAAADGLPATLVMVGSYGPRVYRGAFAGGTARFVIGGGETRASGMATLVATAGAARGEATLTFAPDTPVDPITPLVGARSIAADAQHWSMSVMVPFDRFGNPVAEGTLVEVRALHPGDKLEQQQTEVRHMLAWARIYSKTRAGRTTVTASAAGKYGPEATFMEVPDWPAPFSIRANPTNVPADGRQFVTLRTDVIRDRYGNAMLDGTLVTFVVDTPSGQPRFIPTYTIAGAAETQLQAPREPGALTVHAEVYNAESRPLTLTFLAGPAVNVFPVEVQVDAENQALELIAGPMLGPQQQFIPDGTPVQFLLTDAAGQQTRVDAISDGGYARAAARLAFLQLGTYTVEVKIGAGHGKTTFHVP